jgi:hypothetical protein
MLPLIVIGADDVVRAALEPYAQVGHIEHHPTAETAHWSLVAAGAVYEDHPLLAPIDPRWSVHVGYGPDYFGQLAVGSTALPSRLPHAGHTLILAHDVDPDPGRAIRVTDGAPAGEPPITTCWQAAVAVSADRVLDLAQPDAVAHLVAYLEWKSP